MQKSLSKIYFVTFLFLVIFFITILSHARPTGFATVKFDSKLVQIAKTKEKIPVIIVFKNKTNTKAFSSFSTFSTEVKIKRRYSIINAVAATVSWDALERLRYDPNIEAIYYDRPVHAFLTESVPLINATEVWQRSANGVNLTGAGISICIIDTGVDYTHPDLGNCTIKNVTYEGTVGTLSTPIESPHPYPNNTVLDYEVSLSNASLSGNRIAIHFANISVEGQFDFVEVYDENWRLVAIYTGSKQDVWTPSANGTKMYVRLKSDESVSDYGFYIDKVINGSVNVTLNWSYCDKVIYGWDVYNGDSDPMDDNGHGTHCAGIAAADGALKGVAPDAKIIAVKVLDSSGEGSFSDVIEGIELCTNISELYNISVISLSLGTNISIYGYSNYCDSSWSLLFSTINKAIEKGISVVAASGNQGNTTLISSPACLSNVISVAASNKDDTIAYYSNRNNITDVLAPGTAINSTVPSGTCEECDPSGYKELQGTSMATPHVAGVAALLYQFAKISNKSLTPQEIENVLKETGKKIYDSATGLNFSRVDAYASLQYINDPPVVNNIFINRSQPNVLECWVNITDNESSTDLKAYYEWLKDGSVNVSGSYYPINASTLTMISNITIGAGGNWSCLVTPYDGIENGTNASASLIVGPYLMNASVNPPLGNTSTMFNFTIVYYHLDNINHIVNITIDEETHQMLPANVSDTDVTDGKLYYFNTTLSLGNHTYWFFAGNATENYTTSIYSGPIVDDRPNITYINLTPAEPVVNSTLNCSFIVIDNIWNQTLVANISFLNGTVLYNSSSINITNGTLFWIAIKPPLKKHENWTCQIKVNDGYGYTDLKDITREIQNSPPTIVNLTIINTDSKHGGTLGNLTFNYTEFYDLDGDNVSIVNVWWYRERNSTINTFNAYNISYNKTKKGDLWQVNVNITDGESSVVKTASTTIENTRPLISANITYPSKDQVFNCSKSKCSVDINFTEAYDPDVDDGKDSLIYYISVNNETKVVTNETNAMINLTDGKYNVLVIASDGEANISSSSVNFTVDANPVIDVVSPKNNDNLTSPVTFKVKVTDVSGVLNVSLWGNWSGWKIDQTKTSPSNGYYIFSKDLSAGSYKFMIEACDNFTKNNATPHCGFSPMYSFKVVKKSSGGNSGDGTSGGANTTTNKKSFIWSELENNKTYSLNLSGFVSNKIEFKVNQTIKNAKLNVTIPKNLSVDKPSGNLYSYFEVDTNFENFDFVRLYFSVNKSWIENNSLDKDTIRLNRYNNNSWEPLPTHLWNETNSTYEYYSNLTHLSLFAITGESVQETTSTTTTIQETNESTEENKAENETESEMNETEEEETKREGKGKFSWALVILSLLVGIIAVLIWIFRRRVKILWYYLTS